jgi:molybdate transport system substrate-binding protein
MSASGGPGSRGVARRTLLGALLALSLAAAGGPAAAQAVTVAAAADLKFALEAVAARYEAKTGKTVRLVFGSSGNLARQIEQGAPYAIFMSADEALARRLVAAGRAQGEVVAYAVGRLALLLPAGSPLKPDASLADLGAALADGRLKRLAIANPEHAPYGQRAREALQAAGLWVAAEPRLVLGENVAQAAQFVVSGNAQAGIVAYSLALAPEVARRSSHALLPARLHAPLVQGMVLIKGADAGARDFFQYLQGPEARAELRRQGFALPGEG